jgi:hypothetical protein
MENTNSINSTLTKKIKNPEKKLNNITESQDVSKLSNHSGNNLNNEINKSKVKEIENNSNKKKSSKSTTQMLFNPSKKNSTKRFKSVVLSENNQYINTNIQTNHSNSTHSRVTRDSKISSSNKVRTKSMIINAHSKNTRYSFSNNSKRASINNNPKNLLLIHKERERRLLKNYNNLKELEINSLISKNMIEIRKNCHEHDVYLDHFCFDCGAGICKYCLTLPKHESHIVVEKKNYNIKNENFKMKIFGNLTEELRTALKFGDISLQDQKNNKILNEELYNEYKDSLENKFQNIIEELQKLKQKKLKELKLVFENNDTLISNFDINIESAKTKYIEFIRKYRDLIPADINNDIVFLQNFDIYTTGLQCFNKSSTILNYIKNFKNHFNKELDSISKNISTAFNNISSNDNKSTFSDLKTEDAFYNKFNDKIAGNMKFIDSFLKKFINKIRQNSYKNNSFSKLITLNRTNNSIDEKKGLTSRGTSIKNLNKTIKSSSCIENEKNPKSLKRLHHTKSKNTRNNKLNKRKTERDNNNISKSQYNSNKPTAITTPQNIDYDSKGNSAISNHEKELSKNKMKYTSGSGEESEFGDKNSRVIEKLDVHTAPNNRINNISTNNSNMDKTEKKVLSPKIISTNASKKTQITYIKSDNRNNKTSDDQTIKLSNNIIGSSSNTLSSIPQKSIPTLDYIKKDKKDSNNKSILINKHSKKMKVNCKKESTYNTYRHNSSSNNNNLSTINDVPGQLDGNFTSLTVDNTQENYIDDLDFLMSYHKKTYNSRNYGDQSYKYNYFFSYISNYINYINNEPLKVTLLVEDGKSHTLSKNMNNHLFPNISFSNQESSIASSFFTLLLKYNNKKENEKIELAKNKVSLKELMNKTDSKISKKQGEQEGLELYKPVEGTSKIQLYDSEAKLTFRMELEPIFQSLQGSDKIPYMKFPDGLRSVMIGMSIFIFGGKDVDKEYSAILRYDIDKQSFAKIGDMIFSRSYFSLIYDEGRQSIYLIGGENNKTCERFSLKSKKCYLLPFMHYSRANPTLYLHRDTYLYVFAGFTYGLHKNTKNSAVERLLINKYTDDVDINKHSYKCYWEKISLQNEGCIDLKYDYISITPFTNDYIFICGGFVNRKNERSVSLFDLNNHKISVLDGQVLNTVSEKILSDPNINMLFEEVFKK